MSKIWQNFWKNLLAIIWPKCCLSCDEIIAEEKIFCDSCAQKLHRINEPKCQICSFPFEVYLANKKPICGSCLRKKPAYDRVIAAFCYESTIGKAIGNLKYRDQHFVAKEIAKILSERAGREIANCDIITSIPLHPKKLRQRKFNQSALIANEISKTKTNNQILWRVAEKTSQVGLTQKQRQNNLNRAFLVSKTYRNEVSGKKILLIDDVMTTGATLNSCAKELKRRKAKEVICLVLAKTIFN